MNPKRLASDGFVTVSEAAEFLSVGRSTIYVLMDRGLLPFTTIQRCRRIPRRALVLLALDNLSRATR